MIPILFPADATTFTTHGIGDLVECTECKVKVTDEGEYELALKYPMTGELFSELENSKIVVAKIEPFNSSCNCDPLQAFRIYSFEKALDGMIQVSCQHISYDLSGIPIEAFTKAQNGSNIQTASVAASTIVQKAITNDGTIVQEESDGHKRLTCPFNLSVLGFNGTERPNNDEQIFKIEEPISMRAAILDGDDSLKGSFGGDLIFDNFSIKLKKPVNETSKAILEYGIDITDLSVENNISEMFTDVVGYWKGKLKSSDTEDSFFYSSLRGRGTKADDNKIYLKRNATTIDLTEFFPNPDLLNGNGQLDAGKVTRFRRDLDEKTDEWIKAEHIGEPEINVTVSYAKLDQDVHMHDAVTVRFPKMGIDVTAKVCSYSYDVLNEMCTEVEVGNAKSSAAWKGLEAASRLKRGLLPPKRIADHSINSNHLGYGSVGSAQLDTESVTPEKLVDGVINDSKKIIGGILDGSKFVSQLRDYINNLPTTTFDAEWAAGRVNNIVEALQNSSNYSSFKDAVNKDAKPTT